MKGCFRFVRAVSLAAALLAIGTLCSFAQTPVNIVNPGFEEGTKGWQLPSNYSVVSDVAHTGKCSLKLQNLDPGVYQLSSQEIKLDKNTPYTVGAWVKTKGVDGKDSGATVCLEFWDKNGGYLGGGYPNGIKGDNDWTFIQGDTPAVPEKTARIAVTLYMRRGMTGTAWFDDVVIKPYFGQPLDAALVKPCYRGVLDENSKDQQVIIYAKPAVLFEGGLKVNQTRISCKIMSGAKQVFETVKKSHSGINQIVFDGKKLPVGDYTVELSISDNTGRVFGNRSLELHKISAGSQKPVVYIDEYGRAIRNGKPYFPLGLYFGPGPAKDGSYKEHIDRISGSPFNTIMPYGINTDSLQTIKEYLDYLDSKNVTILYSLKDIFKDIAYYEENMLGLGGEEGQVTGLVNAFKNHPAVLGWYLNDEAPLKYQDRLIERYKLVKKLDPNHPTWTVVCDPGAVSGYLETCDVLGTDPYPMGHGTVDMAYNWAEATVNASGGHKAVWMVPQAHNLGLYGDISQDRAPTMDEMMVMGYLCLIKGAKGLIYYSYFDLQRDPLGFDVRWRDMTTVGLEIKMLSPAVLSIAKAPKIKVDFDKKNIISRTFADDSGNAYILFANRSKEHESSAVISIPAGRKAQLLRHGKISNITSDISNGQLTIKVKPIQACTVILSKK